MKFSTAFVSAGKEYSTFEKHIPAPYFRKSFVLDEAVSSAEITVTGLGFYILYVNGRDITKGMLAPYMSNPDHIIYYDNYDVSEYLRKGENVISLILGNGIQDCVGGEIWDFEKARFRSAPKLALSFEAKFPGGAVAFEADGNFKTFPSPILFDDLRCGVHYDARKEIKGWNLPGFDDSAWSSAEKAETPRGETRLCAADPIVCGYELKPKVCGKISLADYRARDDYMRNKNTAYKPTRREGFLYDFGKNAAGVERLKIKGRSGQVIELQFCEFLNGKGKASYQNLPFYPDGYAQRDIYICKGEGEETFVPPFTYHGFRYCVVMGIDENQATEDLLTYLVCNSALEERGSFSCSDATANTLQEMVRTSDLANFYYFPTDCPHREKNGWTGDAALSCEHMTMNLSPEKSYAEWLRNIRKAQLENGELPGIIPTSGWGYGWGNGPAWDIALVNLPYYTYIFRGDTEILKENASAIFRYICYSATHLNSRGLLAYGLGDWCPVTDVKASQEFTDTITVMDFCKKASVIFGVLGMTLQKTFTDTYYNELKAAARSHFIDFGTMTAEGRCQTSQSMAIYYDLFEQGEKPAAFKTLLDIIHENKDYIDFGILGARVLFHVLSDFGESELAYKMITRPEYPSYGHWVKLGLTALPEDFHRDNEEPSSLNHHFFGDISNWFISRIAGIRVNPYGKNPSEITVAPYFIESLNEAKAYYDTVSGKIAVEWKREGKFVLLTVSAAEGITGSIDLKDGWYLYNEGKNRAFYGQFGIRTGTNTYKLMKV